MSINDANPGDLVFFIDTYDVYAVHGWFRPPRISHVGIYLGDSRMINANSDSGISIDAITTPYWQNHYHSCRRIINGG